MFTGAGLSADEAASLIKNLRAELANQTTNQIAATRTQEDANKADVEALLIKGKNVRAFGLLQKSILDAKGDTELFAHSMTQLDQIFEEQSAFLKDNNINSAEELGELLNQENLLLFSLMNYKQLLHKQHTHFQQILLIHY